MYLSRLWFGTRRWKVQILSPDHFLSLIFIGLLRIAQSVYDGADQGAKAALGWKGAAAVESERDRQIQQLERSLGSRSLEIEILRNVVGE
jgi:hypothetical protein